MTMIDGHHVDTRATELPTVVPMRRTTLLTRTVATLLVGLLLASAGATTALAADGDSTNDDAVGAEGSSDITIDGFDVAFEDVHVTGEGLPDIDVEDRTYTIEERSVTIDGASVGVNDGSIELNDLTVTVTDSTVTLRDVTVGDE